MDRPPPLQEGFVRIALLLDEPTGMNPGKVAKASGVPLDQLGHIVVNDREVILDVAIDHGKSAREQLSKLGPTQLLESKTKEVVFKWLRLNIGRNHGLTIGQLRKVLVKQEAGPIGRFNINNTHTLVGIREDHVDALMDKLAAMKLNGIQLRPELTSRRDSAAFKPGDRAT